MKERPNSNAPFVFLATNDPIVKPNGDRADITPTILKRFGLDLSKIEPPLDGIPLDIPEKVRYTRSGRGSLHASFSYSVVPLVCSCSPRKTVSGLCRAKYTTPSSSTMSYSVNEDRRG
jgi:hypothetical protein